MRKNKKIGVCAALRDIVKGVLVCLLLTVGGRAVAQQYVLTNGSTRLLEDIGFSEPYDLTKCDSIGYYQDASGNWQMLTFAVSNPHSTTLWNQTGSVYIELDTTNVEVKPAYFFSPLCVWTRTSNTGYYYQMWGEYIYYLCGSNSEDVVVKRIKQGDAVEGVSYWYDWDFGAAVQEVYTRNGVNEKEYYWLMYDKNEGKWKMSCNSYNRPETIIYEVQSYQNPHHWYCSNSGGTGPSGSAAQTSLTKVTVVEREIKNVPDDKGLTGIEVSKTEIKYGESATVKVMTDFGSSGFVNAKTNDPYTRYEVEMDRWGINTNYRLRTEDVPHSAGRLQETAVYYVYNDAPGTVETSMRATRNVTLSESTVQSVVYELDRPSRRYVSLNYGGRKGDSIHVATVGNEVTLMVDDLPAADMDIKVYATVSYKSGSVVVEQRDIVTVKLSSVLDKKITVEPVNGPVIGGMVVGGGRMADVEHDTKVTIHSCDTISAVYGGNDVAGEVKGSATVLIGSETTSATAQVHIGSVYGGGCGRYVYTKADNSLINDGAGSLGKTSVKFGGKVYAWGTTVIDESTPLEGYENLWRDEDGYAIVPNITEATVKVGIGGVADSASHNDYVWVDTVFGGAANSFVGDGGSVVEMHGGTVMAIFGGNNIGGALAETSTSLVKLMGSTTTEETEIENNRLKGYGIDFGVRYLFGGGNMVESAKARVEILGGMVDTVFLGGNCASVLEPVGVVDCRGGNFIYSNPTIPDFDTTAYRENGVAKMAEWVDATPGEWYQDGGRYNVRCLFGGNNRANMTSLSDVKLRSGGVNRLYAGGNMGDMQGEAVLAESVLNKIFNVSEIYDNVDDSVRAKLMLQRPSKLGTLVEADKTSRIVVESIYGGCRMADVANSSMLYLRGGSFGYVQGGCDISGDVGSETEKEGTYVVLDTSVLVMQDAYGGGDGYYHCIESGVYTDRQLHDYSGRAYDRYDDYVGMRSPTHNHTNIIMRGGTVMGNLYGGAVLTSVGTEDEKAGTVHLLMTGGTVKTNVYGGGYLSAVYGRGYIHVGGTARVEGSLFAGNDYVGKIETFHPFESDLSTSRGATLNLKEDGTLQAAFASYLLVDGKPHIKHVYGSGNGAYDYDGSRPEYPAYEVCSSGGDINRPLQSSTFIDVHTSGGYIDTVFGGGNGVGVLDNVTVLLNTTTLSNPDTADGRFVGTIFGGNNRDRMDKCVPYVDLAQGTTGDVYGGSNAGDMNGSTKLTDLCDRTVDGVSTYVLVESEKVAIKGSIYGGCNRADVSGMAYVMVKNTSTEGIRAIYGGNNMAGRIKGNTRVDICGGYVDSIYGGSNGYYKYREVGGGYEIYDFDSTKVLAKFATGSPKVASTQVNVFGGTVRNALYGGGRMGECDSTHVVVNDNVCSTTGNATIEGVLFGGGEGYWQDLNYRDQRGQRRGNVNEYSVMDLYHAAELTHATAYGGGRGGDVVSTYITVHKGWDITFDAIYGGCWGSDVANTAHLTFEEGLESDVVTAHNVYGGNDFTGNVYKSELNIGGGRYGNIYGAGNGEYDTTSYKTVPYDGVKRIFVPNNEYVVVNFADGVVDSNLYGGGRMGTTLPYKKLSDGQYDLTSGPIGLGHKTADTTVAHAKAEDYSYIIVNIHDGEFHHKAYAGGRGSSTGSQLVYGLKVLNMYGGTVNESIYGGSAYVSDGYPNECKNTNNTTLRPSSVVNLAGGWVKNNVFGCGYLGMTHGSAFVNIGLDAIDSCDVWTRHYGTAAASGTKEAVYNPYRHLLDGQDSTYAAFKPGAKKGYSAAVEAAKIDRLMVTNSIYAGADWGENTGSTNFNAPGFEGGESRVLVDGRHYFTGESNTLGLPPMVIENSIFGSGTSVLGGDVFSRIDLRNYGELETNGQCHPTIRLHSIQRADELWLHNTSVIYSGAVDAVSSNASNQYTLMRLDTVHFVGFNVLELEATMTEVQKVLHHKDQKDDLNPTPEKYPLADNVLLYPDREMCGETVTMCDMMSMVDPETRKYTAWRINNGINVDILTEKHGYGEMWGFGYLLAEKGTNAVVTAQPKYGSTNHEQGGFMNVCTQENKIPQNVSGGTIQWGSTDSHNSEFPYENYRTNYRVWTIGEGLRTRFAVILAHANPSKLSEHDKSVNLQEGADTYGLGLAHAVLRLPPTEPGHYYKLSESAGVVLEDDNATMMLVDKSWKPTTWAAAGSNYPDGVETNGIWAALGAIESGQEGNLLGVKYIMDDPISTFGLVMASGANFSDDVPHYDVPGATGYSVISGNAHVNMFDNFATALVGDSVHTSPELDLYLTYDTTFSTTILGTVYFTLDEYYFDTLPNYNHTADTIVVKKDTKPINVAVTISTIIDEFRDMETMVLAMNNGGRTNLYDRKVVLPATLHRRELYLKSVTWNADNLANDRFKLTGDSTTVVTAPGSNVFALSIQPLDEVSSSITTAIGWEGATKMPNDADLYSLVMSTPENQDAYSGGTNAAPDTLSILSARRTNEKGLYIGTLDGRGMAGLNVELTFDGKKTYYDDTVGRVVLTFATYDGNTGAAAQEFKLTVDVRTRPHGDTIYVATAPSITRGSHTVSRQSLASGVGKKPSLYVGSFTDALSKLIYQEGDVIAILDTVQVSGAGRTVQISGPELAPIPVIRYDGHHHEFPGEDCVYRGTMVNVTDGATFKALGIDFDGQSTGLLFRNTEPVANKIDNCKVADTNRVCAPVIAVGGEGSSVLLDAGTIVENNFNVYSPSSTPDYTKYGAVNLTGRATLTLGDNVTIRNNMQLPQFTSDASKWSGAVYVRDATLFLKSNGNDGAKIYENYTHEKDTETDWWTIVKDGSGNLLRWKFDDAWVTTSNPELANVYLTRTEGATTEYTDYKDLIDGVNDAIHFSAALPEGTKIGVSTWFPGLDTRDTIRIAYKEENLSRAVMEEAMTKFFDDRNEYDILFNDGVNDRTIYMHRCATFRPQKAGESNVLPWWTNGYYVTLSHQADSMFRYKYNPTETCPTGSDRLLYSVQGGFYPYTYTWVRGEAVDKERITIGTDLKTSSQLKGGSKTDAELANTDVLQLPRVLTDHYRSDTILKWTVTATDVFGCKAERSVRVDVKKVIDAETVTPFEMEDSAVWAGTTPADMAKGVRRYRAIHVEPRVMVSGVNANIIAKVHGSDSIYMVEDDTPHALDSMYFCEGDVLHLSTNLKDTDNYRFIMWDFDPYYTEQAVYVVPPSKSVVVAYYGAKDHWIDVVTSPEIGHVGYCYSYTYSRPNRDDESGLKAGYAATYHGDIHIYDEEGLAWLISVANGYNGAQARQFYYNKIYIHRKPGDGADTAYDMHPHLWTPIGTLHQPFRGQVIGVGSGDTTTVPYEHGVLIKNIVVNEPMMNYTGMFGVMDSARVTGIKLATEVVRGGQYAGGIAGRATHTKVKKSEVGTVLKKEAEKSIFTSHYATGGIVAKAEKMTIENSTVDAKFIGDMITAGGLIGEDSLSSVPNNFSNIETSFLSAMYAGGVDGIAKGDQTWNDTTQTNPNDTIGNNPNDNSDDSTATHGNGQSDDGYNDNPNNPNRPTAFATAPHQRSRVLTTNTSAEEDRHTAVIANNYVRIVGGKNNVRVGGVVGHAARNVIIANNYVYGNAGSPAMLGSVVAVMDSGAIAENNYAVNGFADKTVSVQSGGTMGESATFVGSGNAVKLDHKVDGIDNLTRVLNTWVREQNAAGAAYSTWRSDLLGSNSGYPIFGEPDMIPVSVDTTMHGCEIVYYEGEYYQDGDTLTWHSIDYDEMVDSTMTIHFAVHHPQSVSIIDSVVGGQDYNGYGFHLTATETAMLVESANANGYATFTIVDTLYTDYGCDSVVSLTLAFRKVAPTPKPEPEPGPIHPIIDPVAVERVESPEMRLYPNPTLGQLTVEAEEMSMLELYDNEGRKLAEYAVEQGVGLRTINIGSYPTGIYYVRIYTPGRVDIHKVIKK